MLRAWKAALAKGGDQAFPGKGNPPALEEELRRLRAENKRLTMERDILPLNATIARPSFLPDSSPSAVLMRVRI
jgi:transposase-like protein